MYVLDDGRGSIKIGWAKDPIARMATISAGNPGKLDLVYSREMPEAEARAVERKVHRDLRSQRIGKEWFRATPLEAVSSIDKAMGVAPNGSVSRLVESTNRGYRNPTIVKLPPDLHAKLVAMAIEDDRSLANFIVYRIERAMERIESDHRADLEARKMRRSN